MEMMEGSMKVLFWKIMLLDLFDNEAMPVDILEPGGLEEVEDDIWEEEDNLTLAEIRQNEIAKSTVWTNSSTNCLKVMKSFNEISGPNIPNDVQSPVEIFLHLFPNSLIENIVF